MTTAAVGAPTRFNHVAMSLPADHLDADHRDAIVDFYGDVFGWVEHPTMTEDRRRLVMGVHAMDQFVFLIAEDEPMTAARLDHFGMAAESLDGLQAVLARAQARAESDDRVEIVDYAIDDHEVVRIHNFYVRFLLPMWVEVQYFELAT